MTNSELSKQVAGVAALAEPQRLALYRYVVERGRLVSRDEAATALAMPRHTVAFHMDRLEEDGLLEAEFKRPAGKSGPGAGRPTKFYRRSTREFEISLPERRYLAAGQILAQAMAHATRDRVRPGEALHQAATRAGRDLGARARSRTDGPSGASGLRDAIVQALDEFGYESNLLDGKISLANCPFRALAEGDTELVCGMNLDFIEGLLEGAGSSELVARLEPGSGRCCVTVSER